MSNENLVVLGEDDIDGVTERETVVENADKEKESEKDVFELVEKLTMHPTMIFAEKVTKEKTPGGIYIPENAQDKELTPLVRILLTGKDVEVCQPKDYAYVNPAYMQFAKMNGVEGIVLFQDAILSTYTQEVEDED